MLNCRLNPINPSWRILFPFAVWLIWKSKNQTVFRRKNQNLKLAAEIVNQVMEYMHCVSSPRMPIYKKVKRICRERPPEGWMKLNTNGSSIGNPGVAGCGV